MKKLLVLPLFFFSLTEAFDQNIPVSGDDGIFWAKELASKEGIITGVSGGSTFAIAMEIAKQASKNSNILCMIPDTAERYMSSVLFEDIEAEMNIKEQEIYNSV
jgi:cysteine synthase A